MVQSEVAASEVTVSRIEGTAIITLNAPARRNILNKNMVDAICAVFDELEQDPSVLCVVLTGAGSAFCGGAELSVLEDAASGDFAPVRAVYDGFLRVLASPLPSIAAVNGAAVGAGFNLALACDVRLAAESARFDTRFVQLHLHPGGGHTWLLSRVVGPQSAMLACLFGQVWDAQAAYQHGLVTQVVPQASLLDTAIGLARGLNGHDPEYVRRLTRTLRSASSGASHAETLETESIAQAWSLRQPNFSAGLAAIREQMGRPR